MLECSVGNTFNLSLKEVKNIIQKNKRGIRPEVDTFANKAKESDKTEGGIVTLDGDLDRFDKKQKRDNNIKNRRSNNRGRSNRNRNQNQDQVKAQGQGQEKNKENNPNRNKTRRPKFKVEKKNE